MKAGEQVVTAGQIKLQAYSPVAIDETAALAAAGRDAEAVTDSP